MTCHQNILSATRLGRDLQERAKIDAMSGIAVWNAALVLVLVTSQAPLRTYIDPGRRFQFAYPTAFGDTSVGTNDGFGDRVAAIRFGVFSVSGIGGEAALTRGAPVLDIQAAGGLYDPVALEIFPDAARRTVTQALPRLTPANLCQELAKVQHLDPQSSALSSLPPAVRGVVPQVDRMRNVDPRIVQCALDGTTVTFDKETALQAGAPRQHVYGAVRFLDGPYSTFQIVRAGSAPSAEVLGQMTALVKSWSVPR